MSDPVRPAVDKASAVEDFVDIFTSPAAVFERRRSSSAWLPLLVVTLVMAIGFYASSGVLEPLIDAQIDRQMQAAAAKNPEAAQNADAMAQGRAVGRTFAKVAVVVGTPIAIAAIGLCLWLLGKMVDAKQTAGASVMIAAWSWVPRIIQTVATAIQAQTMDLSTLKGLEQLSIGPARFIDPVAQPLLSAIAARFDVFVLWSTALLAIGLSVVGRVSRASGWVAAGLVWALATAFALYGAVMR